MIVLTDKERIVCVIGDQGFQYNIQELQYLRQWNLPISIVVINNEMSGMISDHEKKVLMNSIHVSVDNGYESLDTRKIANAYNIPYANTIDKLDVSGPIIYEIMVDKNIELTPNLPKGRSIKNMHPDIDVILQEMLNKL